MKDPQAMRFLVVDDDHNSRRIIQLFLQPYGESVLASNGQEAIELHRQAIENEKPFNVIYLDMIMPGLSGLDVLAAFRKQEAQDSEPNRVPVIMLTGETDASNINMAKSFGVVEYLLKPIHEERILQGLVRLDLINNDDVW